MTGRGPDTGYRPQFAKPCSGLYYNEKTLLISRTGRERKKEGTEARGEVREK